MATVKLGGGSGTLATVELGSRQQDLGHCGSVQPDLGHVMVHLQVVEGDRMRQHDPGH